MSRYCVTCPNCCGSVRASPVISCTNGRGSSSASTRRISTSRWKRSSSTRAFPPCTSSARRSGRGGRERIHRIKQAVSHMLVVFPFEERIYRDAGIPVTYVGHPLADVIPLEPDAAAARVALGIATGPVFALLPGSRLSEVKRHARLMLDAARLIRPAPSGCAVRAARCERGGRRADRTGAFRIRPESAAFCPGNRTLRWRPATWRWWRRVPPRWRRHCSRSRWSITYRVPALTAHLMRKQALQPWIGLPNILARDFVVPERVQEAATAENLASDALAWLDDAPRRLELHGNLPHHAPEPAAGCQRAHRRSRAALSGLIDMELHWGSSGLCGVDEAGRGPLAGPVVAAAVMLDPGRRIDGLRDSKKLSAAARERLADDHPQASRRLVRGRGQRRRNRPPEHSAGDDAGHAARRRRAGPRAGRGVGGRQPLPQVGVALAGRGQGRRQGRSRLPPPRSSPRPRATSSCAGCTTNFPPTASPATWATAPPCIWRP